MSSRLRGSYLPLAFSPLLMHTDYFQKDREAATVLPSGLRVLINAERVSAMLWQPKALKPFAHYRFKSMEELQKYVEDKAAALETWQKNKEERKAARKGTSEQVDSVAIGTIFVNSWGYDQTNKDFYQVVEKKGRKLILREVCHKDVGSGGEYGAMASECVAVKDSFRKDSDPITKLLQFSDGKPHISMEFGWASIWDGKPEDYSWDH